jgi:exosortase
VPAPGVQGELVLLDPRKMVPIGVLAALVGWMYHGVLPDLVLDWWDKGDNSHGFLVPLVSLYVAVKRRDLLRAMPARPSIAGGLLLGLGILALLAGAVGAVQYVERTSLVVVLAGLIAFNLGWAQLGVLSFPVLYLLMAIPPPNIIVNAVAFPLQLLAARGAEQLLYLLHIPVLREGNIIELAHTTLEVAEACSGIRSLVSLLALGLCFAYLFHKGWIARTVLTLSAVPIAVVTNVARVAGTGVLAQYFGARAAEGFYHGFSGWFLFMTGLALLALESVLIRRLMRRRERGSGRAA